jgi:hypothetical protein
MSTLLLCSLSFLSETLLLSSVQSSHGCGAFDELDRNKGLFDALCGRYMVPQYGFRIGFVVQRLVKVEVVDGFFLATEALITDGCLT